MDTHTNGRFVSVGGSAQKLGNVTFSAEMIAKIPVVFGTAAYTVVLPKGVLITAVSLLVSTAFAGGTSPSFKVGTTVGGNDILPTTALAPDSAVLAPNSVALAASNTVFVTLTGGPTSGAGYILIHFIN